MRKGEDRVAFAFGLVAGLALIGAPVSAQTAPQAKAPAPVAARLPPGPCASVASLIGAGNFASSDHDKDAAAADYSRAIDQSPRCVTAWLRRAEVRFRDYDFGAALADAKAAVEIAPHSAEAHALLGEAELDQWMDKLGTELKPPYGPTHEQTLAAISDFSRAMDLGLKDAHILLARADAYEAAKDYDRAIADCDGAMALDSDKVEALEKRGFLWHAKGDDDRAQADFARIRVVDPLNEAGYTDAASLYEAEGDLDKAIAILSDGIARPNHGLGLSSRRAELYERKGDFPHAVADWTSPSTKAVTRSATTCTAAEPMRS